jgi:tetratricopeptide (TPR) repeat protein
MMHGFNVSSSNIVVAILKNRMMIGSFYNSIGEYYLQHDNDTSAAMNFYQTALKFSVSATDTQQQSEILYSLAWIKWRLGEYVMGQKTAYEAHRLAKISANLYIETRALRMEAMCWQVLGNYEHSITLYTRAKSLLLLCGLSSGPLHSAIMSCLAEVHKEKSEYSEAHSIYTETLHQVSVEQNPYTHAIALISIAEIDVQIGKPKHDVQKKIDTARSIFNMMGELRLITTCDTVLADLYLREGNDLSARALLKQCIALSWGKNTDIVTHCLRRLADASHWNAPTSLWTVTFFVHALKSKQKLEIHRSLQFLADMFLTENDSDTATALFTVAMEGFREMDVHCSRAECMLRLGDILAGNGDCDKAADLWNTARPLFEHSLQRKQIEQIDDRLSTVNRE